MTAKSNNAVFNSYRAALRSLRSGATDAGPRAGARKQLALEITANRYHLPISEVKAAVREFEEINGISHEHDAHYLRRLEVDKLHEEFVKSLKRTDQCMSCSTTDEANIVRVRVDEILSGSPFSMRNPSYISNGYFETANEIQFTVKCYKCWATESTLKS